jgi:hypothetical protein
MGIQIHAMDNYRRVVELIQSNAIGAVREAHVWVSRAWGWQATDEEARQHGDIVTVRERPTQAEPIPNGLHWDLWLGPAPDRPFNNVYVPGPKWYRWWAFGNGTMSDLGSHWNDLPFWALKLDAPKSIEAIGPDPHPEIAPASMTAIYEYGPRGDLPACKLTWYQGTHKPQIWKDNGIPASKFPSGVLFVGTNGRMLLSDYNKHVLLPEAEFKDFKRPEPFIADGPSQQQEWLLACKNNTPTGSPFHSYAGLLTEANHLGNVAFRAGQKIVWDSAAMKVTNTRAADPFLGRQPRQAVPPQAGRYRPELIRVTPQVRAEQRAEPGQLAVAGGTRVELVDRVHDLVIPAAGRAARARHRHRHAGQDQRLGQHRQELV